MEVGRGEDVMGGRGEDCRERLLGVDLREGGTGTKEWEWNSKYILVQGFGQLEASICVMTDCI